MKKLTVLALVALTAAGCAKPKSDGESAGTTAPSANTAGAPAEKNAGDKGAGAAPTTPGTPNASTTPPNASTTTPTASTTTPADTKKVSLKTGTIMLSETYTTDYTYSVLASFIDATGVQVVPANPTAKCSTATSGDCDVTTCEVAKANDSDPTQPLDPPEQTDPPAQPSAGDIDVAGLDDVTLSPDDTGSYTPASGTTALFKVDTQIKISASGAEIPKFDHTIAGPSQIGMTAPVWPTDDTNLEVDRTKDLVLSWAYGTTGTVAVTMSGVSVGTSTIKTVSLACHYNASAGTGTIGKSTLGKLPADDFGTISIDVRTTDTFDDGDWKLTATAIRPAKVGSGPVPATLTLK
jgi:hypothetical protein